MPGFGVENLYRCKRLHLLRNRRDASSTRKPETCESHLSRTPSRRRSSKRSTYSGADVIFATMHHCTAPSDAPSENGNVARSGFFASGMNASNQEESLASGSGFMGSMPGGDRQHCMQGQKRVWQQERGCCC